MFDPFPFVHTLNAPGVVTIGNALDSETFRKVEETAKRRGKNIGHLMMARKDLGPDGKPVLDHFPVYSDTQISVVGDYTFEVSFGVEERHVEEGEELIFGRPEFESLTEDERRRNVIRLALNAAESDLSATKEEALIPLIGGQFARISSEIYEGVKTRSYKLLSEDGLDLDHTG